MTSTPLAPASSDPPEPFTGQLRLAAAAYLARFTGSSRGHTESDLRCYLAWCAERSLDPLPARRQHLELYIRWMQEIRRFKPSTGSRRFSVTAGFYRTCVLDGIIEHSPAEHVRRPQSGLCSNVSWKGARSAGGCGGRRVQWAVQPPSTGKMAPVR